MLRISAGKTKKSYSVVEVEIQLFAMSVAPKGSGEAFEGLLIVSSRSKPL